MNQSISLSNLTFNIKIFLFVRRYKVWAQENDEMFWVGRQRPNDKQIGASKLVPKARTTNGYNSQTHERERVYWEEPERRGGL